MRKCLILLIFICFFAGSLASIWNADCDVFWALADQIAGRAESAEENQNEQGRYYPIRGGKGIVL